MFKKVMSIVAVAGLVLALAPPAQAGLTGQLGILDEAWFAANPTNPGTSAPWQAGDTYHLAFTTKATVIQCSYPTRAPADPQWTDIANWDLVVQTEADAAGIGAGVGVAWNIIGSTATVNARDHAVVSGAVYNMQTDLIATGFADIWDGTITNHLNHIDGSLPAQPPSYAHLVLTGSNNDGTKTGNPLGDTDTFCTWGDPQYDSGDSWMVNTHPNQDMNRPGSVYGLSEALTVVGDAPPPPGGELGGELGILDLTANGGINPATGNPWQEGDQYRLAFRSSTGTQATSNDINTYNAFVDGLGDAALGGGTWNVLGSTDAVDARDNTSTNPGVDGTGEPIFLTDGATKIADHYADLWDGNLDATLNMFEDGVTLGGGDVFTGTNTDGTKRGRHLGGSDPPDYKVTIGRAHAAGGQWMVVYNTSPTSSLPVYAISDPLTITRGPGTTGDIPEPVTMCALGLAVAGLGGYVRKRRKA